MRLQRDLLRIHRAEPVMMLPCHCRDLPPIQRRCVLVFGHRADGSFQALARLASLSMPRPSQMGGKTPQAFALNAARRLRSSPTRSLRLSRAELRAWMFRAGSTFTKRFIEPPRAVTAAAQQRLRARLIRSFTWKGNSRAILSSLPVQASDYPADRHRRYWLVGSRYSSPPMRLSAFRRDSQIKNFCNHR